MSSRPGELTVPSESTVPGARAFVRSLNVLFKYARLYGLEHARSAAQFDSTWQELQEAVAAAGETGLLLGTSGSQLLLDGVPLESTPAERSFAGLLDSSGVASICFSRGVDREEFTSLVQAFMGIGPNAGTLSERLERYFGKESRSSIRVNEIRFVPEDSSLADARLATQLAAKTLGADAGFLQDWFRTPEKMIQLITAAEGAHTSSAGSGGAGAGTGAGSGGAAGARSVPGIESAGTEESASGAGSAATAGSVNQRAGSMPSDAAGMTRGPAGLAPLEEAEIHMLLRLLAQFGEATQGKSAQRLEPAVWQQKFGSLPPSAQSVLRQALANVAAQTPSAKMDEATLLRLAEDLAIRFALDRFARGEVRVNAVRQMLDRMSHEVETLRKLLKSREERMASAGLAIESQSDIMDRQFWAAVPDSGKRAVLTSPDAWCIPPRNIQQYVEQLLDRGESEAAGNILVRYAACVRNKDAEARKKAAIGLGQLAELYSKTASQRLQDALLQVGQQMTAEKDPELQTLLGAAFVRLSQESSSRRYYRAMQQALDALGDLEESRPSWAQSLRPRTGIENRIPEFIDEALAGEALPEGMMGVLMRAPQVAAEHLAIRLGRAGRRTERESIVEMAKAVAAPCVARLKEILKSEPPARAASVVGLLSRLDPLTLDELLAERLEHGGRQFHDAVVRQLSIGGAPERGRLLANSLEMLEESVLPLALDEIGMCADQNVAPKLLRLAQGEILPQAPPYLRVKAIEALGRMHAPAAAGHLRLFLESRKKFAWAFPEEIRTAAAQALEKIEPEWLREFLPQSGLDSKVLALAPLDPIPERDVVRHRRYRRVRLPRQVPVVITSARGRYSSAISVLSLDGGLLSGDIQFSVGTEATLKISSGLRPISLRAVVRFARSQQAGFETVGMALEDRAKLRRLLVSLGGTDANAARWGKAS